MMLPVILTSGKGIATPGAVQNADEEPTGQTTYLTNPIDDGPHFATADSGVGGEHDPPPGPSGGLWVSPIGVGVVQRANAGTSDTRNGDAPTGCSCTALADRARASAPR